LAHPDDEAFGVAGTVAALTSAGGEAWYACATRGELGEIRLPEQAMPETLGEVREQELANACAAVGMHPPIFLGHRDSGMSGSPGNDDPRAFINQPASVVVRQIVAIIRSVRPHVVVTFEPNGIYGHPDHRFIHRCAVDAFTAAGDPDAFPDAGDAWTPERLYFQTAPRERLLEMFAQNGALAGESNERWLREPGTPEDEITVAANVSAQRERKIRALEAHATQVAPFDDEGGLPRQFRETILTTEYFVRAFPPAPGLREATPFDGLGTPD
jgi:LmbE family N-acetylglucosaminyl deacetylase